MTLRAEVWTLPSSATFEKKFDLPILNGSSGVREMSSYTDESVLVAATFEKIDQVASSTVSSWIIVHDGSDIVDEFRAERVSKVEGHPSVRQISGTQRNGMVEWVGIYEDVQWGGRNLLRNPSFEDNDASPTIYHLVVSATAGSFTLGDGTDTTTIQWDDTRSDIETGLQTDLASITNVAVGGLGTAATPFVIEFLDPPFGVDLVVNDSGLTGTATLTLEEAGSATVSGWTKAMHVLQSKSDQPFGNPDVWEIDDAFASDGSLSLLVDQDVGFPPKGFAGAQQVLNVKPGGTYQSSGDFRPRDADDTFYLTIRTLDGEFIDSSTGGITPGTLTVNTFNTETMVDTVIPSNISQIIWRAVQGGTGDADNNPDPWNFDNAYFAEGFAHSTYTEIVDYLLGLGQARGTLTNVELDATAAADTAGTSLADISFAAWTGDNAHLGHVMEDGKKMGYHWRVVPAAEALVITPAGTTTHVLQIFYGDGEVEDLTAATGGPILVTGTLEEAETVTRTPPYSALQALGAGTLGLEDTDATLVTNMGRIEQVLDAEHLADTTSLQQFLNAHFTEVNANLVAARARVATSASRRPGVAYGEGSKIWWQFPGIGLAKQARVVRRFTWTVGGSYEVQGSTIYTDQAALARAVDRLLNELKRRRRAAQDATAVLPPGGGATDVGARIHLALDAAQSIAVGGEPIEWVLEDHRFSRLTFANPSLPSSDITIPLTDYFAVKLEHVEWDTWDGGGTVQVIRTRDGVDVVVEEWTGTSGSKGAGEAAPIPCRAGDTISVFIDHDDSSAQDLARAELKIYKIHNELPGQWELVFEVSDFWAVTYDTVRGSWFSSDPAEGASPALYELDHDGSTLNSYSGWDDGNGVPANAVNSSLVYVSKLWGVGQSDDPATSEIDPADGSVDSSFSPNTGGLHGWLGIGFDGTNLWLVDAGNGYVEEYTTAGVFQQQITFPSGHTLAGIAWDGVHWWATTTGGAVLKLDTSFVVLSEIAGPPAGADYAAVSGGGPYGDCHFRDGFLYVMTRAGLWRKAV